MSLTFLRRRVPRGVLALAGMVAWAAVAGAWYSQHHLDMQPCPWCILQRILFLVIGALALIGALLPRGGRALGDPLLGGLIVLAGGAGVAAALYQNQVAAKSASCALTLADRVIGGLGLDRLWPDMFEVRASCAEAAVKLFGVPFELWSLALFVLLALVGYRAATWRD